MFPAGRAKNIAAVLRQQDYDYQANSQVIYYLFIRDSQKYNV